MERQDGFIEVGNGIYDCLLSGAILYVGKKASYEDVMKYASEGVRAGAGTPIPQILKEKDSE